MIETEVDICTCQEDGHWFPNTISCCPRKCPMPPNITKVIISGTEFTVNKSITLSCPEGYLLMGTSTSTCQVNIFFLQSVLFGYEKPLLIAIYQ